MLGVYTRCRLHGVKSTGPRTPVGLVPESDWNHGKYSAARKKFRRQVREFCRLMNADAKLLKVLVRAIARQRKRQQREAEYGVDVMPVSPGGESSESRIHRLHGDAHS